MQPTKRPAVLHTAALTSPGCPPASCATAASSWPHYQPLLTGHCWGPAVPSPLESPPMLCCRVSGHLGCADARLPRLLARLLPVVRRGGRGGGGGGGRYDFVVSAARCCWGLLRIESGTYMYKHTARPPCGVVACMQDTGMSATRHSLGQSAAVSMLLLAGAEAELDPPSTSSSICY
jgi:hypothetical protein